MYYPPTYLDTQGRLWQGDNLMQLIEEAVEGHYPTNWHQDDIDRLNHLYVFPYTTQLN